MASILHGASIKTGVLVSGDQTVMAFCRHEQKPQNQFILVDVNDKQMFCEANVTQWLPSAVSNHLSKLSKTIAEKPSLAPTLEKVAPIGSSPPSSKRSKSSAKRR
jgi:hypothetical protein